jgi:mannose-1-phosphate guanylyltransferase
LSFSDSGLLVGVPSEVLIRQKENFRNLVLKTEGVLEKGRISNYGVLSTKSESDYGYILAEGNPSVLAIKRNELK